MTSTEAAATALKAIPGGVTLLSAADVSQQHLTTLGDLLDSVPGVFIEANGNTGAPKISIRGSAVNDGHLFFRTGIQYLFDGLPITGLSGTPFEQWNPQDLADTEVLRGPAGLDFGAEELGGAVNFITHTGYNSPEYLARFDAGSFGYWGGQLSSGKVIGPYDYYISYSGFEAQNFQHDSASNAMRIAADFGYQITPAIDTRFYFRFADAFEQECWGISKAEIKADPSSCSPLNLIDKSRRSNPDSIWVANKTNITFEDNSSLSIGVDYNHYPISGPGILFGSTNWQFDDVSLVLHYKRTDTLFDRPSITSVNLLTTTAVNSVLYAYPGARSLALAFSNLAAGSRFTGSSDVNLDISNDYEIVPRLWLTNAIDGVFTNRVNDYFKYPVPGILPQQDRAVTDFQGRVGARYDVLPSVQIYGTVGRTVEPERAFDPIQFGGGYTTISQLKAETELTEEIGLRGNWSIFNGSLSLYHADVRDELLGVKLHPTDISATYFNASPTTHQGVELGLDTTLWRAAGSTTDAPNAIVFRQNYTYTDLHYDNDALLGHNQLPGIPPNFYEAELRYTHPSGVYAGVNTQYSSGYYVDYANTYKNNAFVVLGAKVGYSPSGGHWDTYLQAKNLTNAHYAASILTQYDLHGKDSDLVFVPGDGFGVFGGVTFHM